MDATNLKVEMTAELERILAFWQEHAKDETHGGFFGELDHLNQVNPIAEKSSILNARILWTFSSAYRLTKTPSHKLVADRAFQFVVSHFVDSERGGVYWSLNADGSVANDRKQLYAIAFAIYGLSEYYGATGYEEALVQAKSLFRSIEDHGYDREKGGYYEAYAGDWADLEDFRLSEKDENAPKSMNTHLHIMEAYANLLRYWQDDELKQQLRHLIEVSMEKIIQDDFHFGLFFDADWNPSNRNVSYGHDIEGSWLLQEAAEVLGDEALLIQVKEVALKMAEATYNEGIAPGAGVMEELHIGHGVKDPTFHWWPQAEGVVGFYNAYQLTGDEKFLKMATRLWEFARDHLFDKENGEWFWHVDASGNAVHDACKVGFWKCPYHNGRACMEIMHRIKS